VRFRGEEGVDDVKLVAFGTRYAKEEAMRAWRRPVSVVFRSLHAARILVTFSEDTEINLTWGS
jgi:hypothetical protein